MVFFSLICTPRNEHRTSKKPGNPPPKTPRKPPPRRALPALHRLVELHPRQVPALQPRDHQTKRQLLRWKNSRKRPINALHRLQEKHNRNQTTPWQTFFPTVFTAFSWKNRLPRRGSKFLGPLRYQLRISTWKHTSFLRTRMGKPSNPLHGSICGWKGAMQEGSEKGKGKVLVGRTYESNHESNIGSPCQTRLSERQPT